MLSLHFRLVAPLIICLLGACSDDYGLRAVSREGRIAFVRDEPWIGKPDCIHAIEVRADNGRPATTPQRGDDEVLVRSRGVYWSAAPDEGACRNRFPIAYGERLGTRLPAFFPFVAAKPLKAGVVYEVWVSNKNSGSGRGWFRILPNGQLENYPTDPTPALLDENGWQAEGGQQQGN
jgi:hypothetical protein